MTRRTGEIGRPSERKSLTGRMSPAIFAILMETRKEVQLKNSKTRLVSRRWKVLLLAGAGYDQTEIRTILGISQSTLARDLSAIRGGSSARPRKASPVRDRLVRHAREVLAGRGE